MNPSFVGQTTEIMVAILAVIVLVFIILIWLKGETSIEILEEELLSIRKKAINFVTRRSLNDEYSLYKEKMNGHTFTMSYQDWLINRIVIEGPEEK